MVALFQKRNGDEINFLSEELGDGFSFFAGHFEGAAGGGKDGLVVGETHSLGDDGVEVFGTDFVFDDVFGSFIGFSVNLAAADAAACVNEGEGFREMVASGVGGNFRGASEFGGDDDESGVEEAARFEVV